ncbi:D(2) dopamine receptor [Biomphalaria pfeifferi]|uniref:D(2) dopamine receptor n=1 Tax=Biomphalaria pfeifferi TaxID=112525 RepID=A0AAD8EZU8_BIOPF|nr:D(2) dopamine receptor [Biomphalaria pfeifferi]
MIGNISKNYTPEEIKEYLSGLQHESTLAFIPALIYLSLLIVVGSIGNCFVLGVYWTKMPRTPLRLYIIVMAIYDLPTNLLVIPGDIYDTFHVWDFDMPVVCKLRRYFNAVCVMSSIFVLVAIATTRQVTITQAKVSSILMLVVGLVLSIPYSVIHGSQTISTPVPGIYGHFCQVDDFYVTTKWPLLNSAFFIIIFITCCSSMIVFYICIGCKTWKHRQISRDLKIVEKTSRCEESDSMLDSSSAIGSTDGQIQSTNSGSLHYRQQLASKRSRKKGVYNIELHYCNNRKEVKDFGIERKSSILKKSTKKVSLVEETNLTRNTKRRSLFGRTSWMMITVSLVFIIGFIPFLGLNFYKTAAPESYASLKGISLAMYQLFSRSYLLNSAVNPIVYSLLDRKFRKECFKLLTCYTK